MITRLFRWVCGKLGHRENYFEPVCDLCGLVLEESYEPPSVTSWSKFGPSMERVTAVVRTTSTSLVESRPWTAGSRYLGGRVDRITQSHVREAAGSTESGAGYRPVHLSDRVRNEPYRVGSVAG